MTITWNEYLALPEDGTRQEVLDGELVVSPAPTFRHQRVLGQLLRLLLEQVDDAGLGTVMLRPFDVKLSDVDVVEPDILVVLRENLGRLGPEYLDGPPDLAVEILSPGTARRDRGKKMERYRLFSIREYWIVDTEARVIEQFVLADGDYRLSGRREISIELHVAPGVRLDLDRVW